MRCKPSHPSPSARQFRLLLNGLAAAELRRMFCSDEGACMRFGCDFLCKQARREVGVRLETRVRSSLADAFGSSSECCWWESRNPARTARSGVPSDAEESRTIGCTQESRLTEVTRADDARAV